MFRQIEVDGAVFRIPVSEEEYKSQENFNVDEVNKKASDQGKWVAYEVRWNEKTEYKESLIIHSHIGFSSEYFIENKTTADQIVTNHLSFVEGL